MTNNTEWIRLVLFYLVAVVIGWWAFRVTDSYFLVTIMVVSVLIDLIVRIYLYRARSNPNRFTKFLRADTMPQVTTHSEIWKQVALSALFYSLLAAAGGLLLLTVFESPVVPILMAVMILLIFVPERYRSLRRYYRPVEIQDGVDPKWQLVFDANMKSIYGSRLLRLVHFALVMIVTLSLAFWLT